MDTKPETKTILECPLLIGYLNTNEHENESNNEDGCEDCDHLPARQELHLFLVNENAKIWRKSGDKLKMCCDIHIGSLSAELIL